MLKTPTARQPSSTPTAKGTHDGDPKYTTGAWPKVSRKVRSDNPICQKILNVGLYKNEQCHNASQLVHHRHGAIAYPELFLSVYDKDGVSNLIALCLNCHVDTDGTDGTNGTDNWIEGVHFVRTEYREWRVG
jgi:hypothetical protein